ncbi:hypothetical protein [Rhizobium leguminosarum]|uniref:hypothetical protein n=1 Tax=Rhizobium leguminosarum TaxID=384 RepID=UPI00103B4489|nr:hypothetical protein [Rhizobium leguminosarum]TBY41585.1 hypothetical protein E0H54_30815 [Rhizobium leguminosarum bv. viciae]
MNIQKNGISYQHIERIRSFFASKEDVIQTEGQSHSFHLTALRSEQNDVHRQIASYLSTAASDLNIAGDNRYAGPANEFAGIISKVSPRLTITARPFGGDPTSQKLVEVESPTSILREEKLAELIQALLVTPAPENLVFRADIVAFMISAYMTAFKFVLPLFDPGAYAGFGAHVRWADAVLASLSFHVESKDDLNWSLAHIESRIAETRAMADKYREDLATLAVQIDEQTHRRTEFEQATAAAEQRHAEMIAKVDMTEAAWNEQVRMKATHVLWRGEARWKSAGYYISLTALLVILGSIPVTTYAYRGEILALVNEVEGTIRATNNAVTATIIAAGRLLLIGIPVAGLVWALKLLVRFNMRSMLLMDDARQRVTMLNTYLFLVKEGAATPQDRGALLEAMFRRAPGHGPETIDPPNMADLMKYGEVLKKT